MTSLEEYKECLLYLIKHDKTILHRVCRIGDIKSVKLILKNNSNINYKNYKAQSPLYIACQYNHIDIAKLLLDNDAKINQLNSDKSTAFFVACEYGHIDIVKLLLKYGADIMLPGIMLETLFYEYSEKTPLDIACKSGYIEIVRVILESKVYDMKDNSMSVYLACENNKWDVVNLLFDKGQVDSDLLLEDKFLQNIKLVSQFLNRNVIYSWNFYLRRACRKGYIDTVSLILDHYTPESTLTFIQDPAINRNIMIVKILIEHGFFYSDVIIRPDCNSSINKAITLIKNERKIVNFSHGYLQDLSFPKVLAALIGQYITNTQIIL
jgi:ankyrin repeat protein